jgi:small-conductance mechanosensitive channel
LLSSVYLGNSLKAWLIALAVGLVVYLTLVLIQRVLVTRLGKLAERTDTDFDDAIVDLVKNTRSFFILALAVYTALRGLYLHPRLLDPLDDVIELLFLLQVGVWAAGLVSFLVKRSLDKRDQTGDRIGVAAVRAIGVTVKIIAWIVVGLLAIQFVFKKDITTLLTVSSIGGVAIALAVQNILGDILAAVAIVFDRPFDVGDSIQVDQVAGKVEQIGLKTTRLRSVTGEQLIVGNADLLRSRLRNFKRMYERRALLYLDLTYDTPPDLIEKIPGVLKQIIQAQTGARFERAHFSGFMESSLRLELVYFVLDPDYTRFMDVQQSINLAILRRFNADGVQFAFPTRTVQLHGDGLFMSPPSAAPVK